MTKAFVALSGGIDSTTVLHYAMQNFDEVEALGIDYGQRHKKETTFAMASCEELGIDYNILDVEGLADKGVMLTDSDVVIPNISYDEIEGVSPTYVPFRNGNILARIAAYAQLWVMRNVDARVGDGRYSDVGDFIGYHTKQSALEEEKDSATILIGIHAEDAQNWAYPDCTPEFFGSMANAIYIGTYFTVRVQAPLLFMNKKQIVQWGTEMGVNWSNTWSCYAGEEIHCGICPTCRARKQGFIDAGVADPTFYETL